MTKRGQKLLAAGTTMLIAEPLLVAAAHQGMLGAIVGVGAGLVAYNVVEDLEKLTGKLPSLPAVKRRQRTNDEDQPGALYRILNGKSTRDEQEAESRQAGDPIFPKYRDDETLRLGSVIDKEILSKLAAAYQLDPNKKLPKIAGRRFDPHIDGMYGKSIIIAATPGSGKSMLIGLFVEQVGECDGPVFVLDHKGEYTGIAELSHLSGLIAGGESARRKAEQLGVPYFPLTTKNVDAFVEKVISEHLQAIVMLPSYGERWLAKAEIVAEVGHAVMHYSARQIEAGVELLPCLVILDEAQLYLPERVEFLPPEARKNGVVLESLYNAFFDLATAGRSNGYTVGFATQSLTYIGKWAIKECQIKVLMRHAEHNDLETVGRIIGKVADRSEMESMPPGVGVVVGFTPKPMIVQFDTKQSRDASRTPGVQQLREARAKQQEPVEQQGQVKIDGLAMDELVRILERRLAKSPVGDEDDEDKDDEEEQEEQQAQNIVPMPVPIVQDKGPRAEDIDLAVAIVLWNNGYNSERKLMKAFPGLTLHQAGKLSEMIKEHAKKASSD